MSNFHIHVFSGLNQTTKSANFFQMNECDLMQVEGKLCSHFKTAAESGNHIDSIHAVVRWTRDDGAACSARYKTRHRVGHGWEAYQHSINLPPRSRKRGDQLGYHGTKISSLLAEAHDFSDHQPLFVKPELTEGMAAVIADLLCSDGTSVEEAWALLVEQMRKDSV